jgi:hypothetical protein
MGIIMAIITGGLLAVLLLMGLLIMFGLAADDLNQRGRRW